MVYYGRWLYRDIHRVSKRIAHPGIWNRQSYMLLWVATRGLRGLCTIWVTAPGSCQRYHQNLRCTVDKGCFMLPWTECVRRVRPRGPRGRKRVRVMTRMKMRTCTLPRHHERRKIRIPDDGYAWENLTDLVVVMIAVIRGTMGWDGYGDIDFENDGN